MPSTIDIRRRIRSVKNTQQITKAMKMVAAAKLRRAQERMFAARPYAGGLRQVLASVAARVDINAHPLLQSREPERNVVVVVVTSDRGLCGAFNANVIRAAQNFIRESAFEGVELLTIGRKAGDFFRRRTIPIRRNVFVAQALSVEVAHEIADSLIKDFVDEKIDGVYVVYNEFKSLIAQHVRAERLLPIAPEFEVDPNRPAIDYLYEPGPEQILSDLLPKHIEFQLYRVLLESAAAEQGARMTAMEAATKNASDMIDHLTLTYNRIRQAAITKEIIEIVSGASAAQ
ncbi:MAG TPA: ATP synthase F1 subunit gamma [Thermoanaerobaculia bacterium]|jgi:F-type H+-transporting ATPase subunit gamma|nr:ATP synthase F1 subunit gamma [Thermoanaerobaculia bacterium]